METYTSSLSNVPTYGYVANLIKKVKFCQKISFDSHFLKFPMKPRALCPFNWIMVHLWT